MSTEYSELICPDCGAREQREAFCESCGAALSRAKPAPAAPAAFEESDADEPVSSHSDSHSRSDSPSLVATAGPGPKDTLVNQAGSFADRIAAAAPESIAPDSNVPDSIASEPIASAAAGSEPRSGDVSGTVPLPRNGRADPERDAAERAAAKWAESERIEAERAEAERAAARRAEAENAERARALLVPVADQSAPAGIVPVLPGVPDPIAPQRNRSEGLAELDAGIQCQWCATRNPPERHFCRKCGQRLAYAPVEAKRPSWWRRLIFFWRNRPLPFAGQRPRLRRGPGQAIRPAVWGVVLIVVIVVVVQEYKPVSTNVRDHFSKPNEISNWTVATSHQDPNHPAKLLHDTYSDTWWGSGFSPQNSNGVSITVTFSQPTNLLDMGITPGAGTATDTFGAQGAPETVDALLIPLPGKGDPVKKTFTLDDQAGFQKLQLRGDDIRQVVLTITSSYDPTGVDPAKANQTETAITELEFYSRH
ncbi:hypothetical protein KGQ20_30080 [Catenulispora sp. NF23]|uniref:Zinc ribbon domain-containing protein n=1 Tax=Catenulispora pinistramenti TaxID=2705254 RepID=A0ABS5L4E2_9ACTN|nr:hypothetical protein [Catenulispora pinistramenti]MBS2537015.1 hypothetical protein [Catenulispora pinistramenti]MBS2553084.1 hypothetical protein [Catenulispora pinistramenti]